jgi:UDP-N-acetylmuramyl pentapeptide phosphotransferase/UDP-N-acetylglucosamine-1-phosphate transferase
LSKPVSPIFILLLLWYPAFENLFSIIRRLTNKINLSNPDNFHLHHLLFMFIKRYFNNKIANKYINSLTGTIINFYNSIIFILASQIYFYTNYLSYLVLLNIFIYLFSYYFLIKYRSKF